MATRRKKLNASITTSADYQPSPNVFPVPHAWKGARCTPPPRKFPPAAVGKGGVADGGAQAAPSS